MNGPINLEREKEFFFFNMGQIEIFYSNGAIPGVTIKIVWQGSEHTAQHGIKTFLAVELFFLGSFPVSSDRIVILNSNEHF